MRSGGNCHPFVSSTVGQGVGESNFGRRSINLLVALSDGAGPPGAEESLLASDQRLSVPETPRAPGGHF